MTAEKTPYYIPHETRWPIFGAIGMFLMFLGAINWIHGYTFGPYLFGVGFACIIILMFGWFGLVIRDNRSGKLDNAQMDRTFRQGIWCS